jgi:Arc/MetJ-type ribon-helix-helix transcriptional regulator
MTTSLKPETERLVREEIHSGHVQSVDDLIQEGVRAVRSRMRPATDKRQSQGVATRIRELRKNVVLDGLRIKYLAHEGHRF